MTEQEMEVTVATAISRGDMGEAKKLAEDYFYDFFVTMPTNYCLLFA